MEKTHRIVVLVIAVVTGAVGPRFVGKTSAAAHAPFEYTPPDGFVEMQKKEDEPQAENDPSIGRQDRKIWVPEGFAPIAPAVKISLTHSASTSTVEEEDLAKLAQGMPAAYNTETVTWKEVRHETLIRSDGAHVGLLEGERITPNNAPVRTVQLAFPDDNGTSIVSASFLASEAAKWEAIIGATAETAKGVAIRLPPKPLWMNAAFAGAGAVFGFLVMSLAVIFTKEREKPVKLEPVPVRRDEDEQDESAEEDESADDDEDEEEEEEEAVDSADSADEDEEEEEPASSEDKPAKDRKKRSDA